MQAAGSSTRPYMSVPTGMVQVTVLLASSITDT